MGVSGGALENIGGRGGETNPDQKCSPGLDKSPILTQHSRMDLPPRIEDIACPTCGERALRARTEGLGAECAECGQLVIFDEDTTTVGKKRNYTPQRDLKKLLGDQPAPVPQEHAPVHLPDGPARDTSRATPLEHRGPLPAVKSIEEMQTTVIASHALESVRREHWKKQVALLASLIVVTGAALWAWREHQRAKAESLRSPITTDLADPANRTLVQGADLPEDDTDVTIARDFLKGKILPAGKWEDLLPHVRLPEQVAPMMTAYYADHEFQTLAKSEIRSIRVSRNPAGKFVVLLLDHPVQQVAMVELGGDGPRLDWEILVNLPLREWENFVKSRPSAPTNTAVAVSRCYVREDYLTPEELPKRAELLGVRIGMPGNPVLLFSAVPIGSPLGQSLAARLPWEHDNKSMIARATLSFAPEHAPMQDRVILYGEPSPGWNRLPSPPATAAEAGSPPLPGSP